MTDWWWPFDTSDILPSIDLEAMLLRIFLVGIGFSIALAGLVLLVKGYFITGLIFLIGGVVLGLWQLGAFG